MDTAFLVTQERTHANGQLASPSSLVSTRPGQERLNLEYENSLLLARRIPAVRLQKVESPIVILVGGPYGGQDIRVTEAELDAGSILRNGQRYLRAGTESILGMGGRLPTFKWESGPVSVRARDAWTALEGLDHTDAVELGLAV
jgi:hypothetical protein